MTSGETLYLALVLSTFCGFGAWLFYVNWRYDRMTSGKPEARRYEMPQGIGYAAAD
jgi:hypothetical protein